MFISKRKITLILICQHKSGQRKEKKEKKKGKKKTHKPASNFCKKN